MNDKRVLIIGLGEQGKKYIQFFLKKGYFIKGICKTKLTQSVIQNKYNILVEIGIEKCDLHTYDIIIVCLPPSIQGQIALNILQKGYSNMMVIEIPVTWCPEELKRLQQYNNVKFFLEEYYTLLAGFMRKIQVRNISNIEIEVFMDKDDYEDEKAKKVMNIHIQNNFLGLGVDMNRIVYRYLFHEKKDIFYTVRYTYNGFLLKYVFHEKKYLQIGKKQYIDNYNFDKVLTSLLEEKINFNHYYSL